MKTVSLRNIFPIIFKKLRHLYFLLFLLISIVSQSQVVSVDKVKLFGLNEAANEFFVPQITRVQNRDDSIVSSINNQILENLILDSFVQEENVYVGWLYLDFDYEFNDSILLIGFYGEFLGAYISYIDNDLIFDLNTGQLLTQEYITVSSLFDPEEYFDFIGKFWKPKCDSVLREAYDCAGYEPDCNCSNPKFDNYIDSLFFILDSDCYPHIIEGCEPYFKVSVANNEVSSYLSDFGRFVINSSGYDEMSTLNKYVFSSKRASQIERVFYLEGYDSEKVYYRMFIRLNEESDYLDVKIEKPELKESTVLKGVLFSDYLAIGNKDDGEFVQKYELKIENNWSEEGYYYNGGKYLCLYESNPENQNYKLYSIDSYYWSRPFDFLFLFNN
jgi:hypothetical protein